MAVGFISNQTTFKNVDRDFVDWHKGRQYYYVWAILIDQPCWLDQLAESQRQFAPYLVEAYARQGHVTLLPAGFLSINSLPMEDIAERLQNFSAFDIELGPIDSFTGSPYHQIIDPTGQLSPLRKMLRTVAVDPHSEVDDKNYVPHLTVGLYKDVYSLADIGTRIGVGSMTLRACPVVSIAALSLVRYETNSIKGALEEVARFGFDGAIGSTFNQ